MLSLAAIAAVASMATAANATTFAGSWNVDAYNGNNGLQIDTTPDSHSLSVTLSGTGSTATKTINLFKIYTNEDSVDGGDTTHQPITVDFNFTSPGHLGDDVDGVTFAVDGTQNHANYGAVTWNGPAVVNFANGDILTITLSNETFNSDSHSNDLNDGSNHGAEVQGTFTLTRAAAAPTAGAVPEPASWALMIGGFGMAGASLRRRRTMAATA
jgi:PEP-CTERM motif